MTMNEVDRALAGLRDQFLLRPGVVFLNHGSFGACPRPVFEEYQTWQLELERQPVEFVQRRSRDLLHEARQALRQRVADALELRDRPRFEGGVSRQGRSPPRPGRPWATRRRRS